MLEHVKRNSFSLIDIFLVNYILTQIGRLGVLHHDCLRHYRKQK